VVEHGILRFGVRPDDEGTRWYVAKGGSNFSARMRIPYTMSSLDAPVYRGYIKDLEPVRGGAVALDVGAADGRNTDPLLEYGCGRVIATDISVASLARLQQRVAAEHPEWLERLALIECDARQLPIASNSVDTVVCTEVLSHLNEDYLDGVRSCARVLKPGTAARLLLSERAWEGCLLARLLYSGVAGLVQMKDSREMVDGAADQSVRSRTFTEAELAAMVQRVGLTVLERKGTPLLSLVFGYLSGKGVIGAADQPHLAEVQALINMLGETGVFRRTHTLVAHKAA
jgi:SAM-dependent methyltransferase